MTGRVDGYVTGIPRLLLRLEGGAMLAAASAAYVHRGAGWGLFAALFLLPDLSMLGYLLNRRLGAALYNVGHNYLSPGALTVVGLASGHAWPVTIALVWLAHIGFDRAVGYGLKYGTAFGDTHLGRVGRR